MPGGNRTGPKGMGPRTGRAAGYCSGFGAPGYANMEPGRGSGRSAGRGHGGGRDFRGGGRGRRNVFYATGIPGWMRYGGSPGYPANSPAPDPEMETQALRNQAEALQAEMDAIKKRIGELEAGRSKE